MKRSKSLFQVLFLLAVFAISLIACPVHFLTNDDYALMQLVASWRSGTPEWFDIYNNVLYSAPLSFLYRIWGSIPWYPIIQITIIFFATFEILRCMLSTGKDAKKTLWVYLAFLCLFVGFILPNLIFLQYSVVAAISGSAACILLLNYKSGFWNALKIAIFALISLLIRKDTAVVVFCMLIAAWSMTFLQKKTTDTSEKFILKNLQKTVIPIALTVFLCSGAALLQKGVEKSPWLKDFMEYNSVRISYIDYDHRPDYQESDVYQQIGWSESFFDMTGDWFFMDERFTADALNTIMAEEKVPALSEQLSAVIPNFIGTLKSTNIVRDMFLIFLGLSGAAILMNLIKRDFLGALRSFIPAACFFTASMYLCYQGRFPQHAFYACILPASVLLFYEWLRIKTAALLLWIITSVALAAMFALSFNSAEHVFALSRSETYLQKEKLSDDVDVYAMEHPDDIIITDVSIQPAGSPWKTEKDIHPLNRFFWGGWYYNSPFYYAQLKLNGINTLYSSDFYNENVLLLNVDPEVLEEFLVYMSETYGKTEAIPISIESDFTVYRFIFASEAP